MGQLTAQVIDTLNGRPAASLLVTLERAGGGRGDQMLRTAKLNADGRTERPLLDAAAMAAGRYRLSLAVGPYYRAVGGGPAEPAFLDVVPVDFGVADAAESVHLTLLVSPWTYSVVRSN